MTFLKQQFKKESEGDRAMIENCNSPVPFRILLIASGLIGFVLGGMRNSCWQAAVEGAQVLAGLVQYPTANPFYIYQVKSWTLLHQLPALGLLAGISEQSLSVFLCGVTGLVAFQALALSVYVFCRNVWLSLLAAWFIYATQVYAFGVNYQIPLMGGTGTYGALGFSFLFVSAALLGTGRIRLGALCLGLAPAIHAGWGVLGMAAIGLAVCSEWKQNKALEKYFLPFFGAGLFFSLLSYGWQWRFIREIPPADPELARRCLEAFVRIWDGHRQPIPLRSLGVEINGVMLIMSSLGLSWFRNNWDGGARLMLRIYQAASVLAILFSLISRLPVEWIPSWFLTLMAPRLLNFSIFGFPGFLIGVWFLNKKSPWIPCLALLAVALPDDKIASLLFVLLAGTFFAHSQSRAPQEIFRKNRFWILGASLIFLAAGIYLKSGVLRIFHVPRVNEDWRSRDNDPFLKRVSKGTGFLVISSDLGMKQLVTRRALLLDPVALDGLAYAPEAGPEMFRIMKEVYGTDLFLRPEGVDGTRSLPHELIREVWAARDLETWKAIRRTFKATQILASKITVVQLPKIDHNDEYDLYEIPE